MAKQTMVKAETTTLVNKAILGTYTGKCCDAAVVNNNDMKLDRELFEKLIGSDEYKDAMEHGYYIGFLGHPEDPNCQDFKNGCIVMKSMEIKSNDEIYGTFDLVNTPVGQIVKTYIDAGVKFGISIRGAGDVDANGNVDPDTFIFRGFDLVSFPAYNDAVPEFLEIAASTDPKYKKIKAAIETNLPYISSATAISELQATLNPHSAEYKKLEARKQDIGTPEDVCPECSDEELEEITAKKVRCMTDMYMEQSNRVKELEAALAATKAELRQTKIDCSRKIDSLKRITASQNALMKEKYDKVVASKNVTIKSLKDTQAELQKVEASNQALKTKNSEIITELNSVKSNNLIYKQKIECSSADIEDRDETISQLQKELNKTVVASTTAKREASNRDEEVKHLQSEIKALEQEIAIRDDRIVACEENVHQFQQAYADFYATARGISVSGLAVTASTSVRELEDLIQGATNTSNISIMPGYGVDEEEGFIEDPIDVVDGLGDNNLPTL